MSLLRKFSFLIALIVTVIECQNDCTSGDKWRIETESTCARDAATLCTSSEVNIIKDPKGVRSTANHALCHECDSHCTDDSYLEQGWYRFDSPFGTEIPTTCPKVQHSCGTKFPKFIVDINLENRPASQIWKAHACANTMGDCCSSPMAFKRDIQMYHCPNFWVYYLRTVSRDYSRYCFGNVAPPTYNHGCTNGTTTDDGTTTKPSTSTTPEPIITTSDDGTTTKPSTSTTPEPVNTTSDVDTTTKPSTSASTACTGCHENDNCVKNGETSSLNECLECNIAESNVMMFKKFGECYSLPYNSTIDIELGLYTLQFGVLWSSTKKKRLMKSSLSDNLKQSFLCKFVAHAFGMASDEKWYFVRERFAACQFEKHVYRETVTVNIGFKKLHGWIPSTEEATEALQEGSHKLVKALQHYTVEYIIPAGIEELNFADPSYHNVAAYREKDVIDSSSSTKQYNQILINTLLIGGLLLK